MSGPTAEFTVEHGPAGRGALPRAVYLLVKTGGHAFRLETGTDGPQNRGQRVRAPQAAPHRDLQRPQSTGEVQTAC